MTELAGFDPHAPALEPPYEAMAELRAGCPVAATAAGWFIASHEDVKSVLQQVDTFTGVGGSYFDTTTFPPDELNLPNMPEPQHGRVRKVVNGALARHRTAELAPFIRELASGLLDRALDESRRLGEVDLMEAYAAPIPSRAVARALGVPVEDADRFQQWSVELVQKVWYEPPAPFSALHPTFAAYIQDLIEARRAEGGPSRDIISRLMEADIDGERLSDAAVRTNALNLIVGGNETTASLIGHTLRQLAADPDLLEAVRADRSQVPTLVEESLRMYSPLQVLDRNIQHDAEVGGTPVPAGERVVIGIASANRDGSVFEHPDEFRMDRPRPKDHLAFGAGPYVCPGATLARLEATEAVEVFLDRVARASLVEGRPYEGNPLYWAYAPYALWARIEGVQEA